MMDIDEMRKVVREGINLIDKQQKLIVEQGARIERLEKLNEALRHENGLLRLKRDMQADAELPALLRTQAE